MLPLIVYSGMDETFLNALRGAVANLAVIIRPEDPRMMQADLALVDRNCGGLETTLRCLDLVDIPTTLVVEPNQVVPSRLIEEGLVTAGSITRNEDPRILRISLLKLMAKRGLLVPELAVA